MLVPAPCMLETLSAQLVAVGLLSMIVSNKDQWGEHGARGHLPLYSRVQVTQGDADPAWTS